MQRLCRPDYFTSMSSSLTTYHLTKIELELQMFHLNFIIMFNSTINQNVWSPRLLKQTNFKTKMFLFKTTMQPKITYSYPIYHLLSKPKKIKIQACQNIQIYRFILINVPHYQHPNSEYRHVKMRLKSIAQVAWEHGRKFHKRLKQGLPELYNMFEEYTQLPIVKTKNSRVRISPMQFARAPRPTYFYSEDHFTENMD